MKRKLSMLLAAIFVISIVLSMAGCGAKTDDNQAASSAAASSTAGTSAEAPKDEPVTLTYMHYYKSDVTDSTGYAFHQQIAKYKAEHSNVTVDEEELGVDTYETKIKTVAAANEMPDMFIVKGSMIDSFIDNQLIGTVSDILEADKAWYDNFVPGAFDEFKRDGKIYAIPFDMTSTSVIFYNKQIFEECGLTSFPATWDELVKAVGVIKAKGYTPIVMGNKGKWLAESCVLSTLADRFTGSDWFFSIRDHKGAKFTDPEFVKSLDAFQQLSKAGAFNTDLNSIDNDQQRSVYYNKKAAMFFEGAWAIGSMANDAPKDVLANTEMVILPSVNGGKGDPAAMSSGSGWGNNMSAQLTGNKKAVASEILKYISNQDFAKITAENNGFPAMQPSADMDKTKISELAQKYLALSEKTIVAPIYDAQLSSPIIEVMSSGLQELLINQITPEDLAKKIQAEYEKP